MDLKPQMLPDNFLAVKEEYYSSLAPEEHPMAKIWVLRDPAGKVHEVKNLINFFREHADELDGTPEAAARGIKQIKATMLGKRKHGGCNSWKGWTLDGWDDCGIAERGSGGKKAGRKYGNTVKRSFYSRVAAEGDVVTRKYHYTMSGGKLVRELLSNPGELEDVHVTD